MKKFAILLSLIAALAVAGCSSDEKPAASSQIPQAAPAQKVDQQRKINPKEQPGYVEMKGNGRKMAHF